MRRERATKARDSRLEVLRRGGKAVAARAKAKADRVRTSEGGRGTASERPRTAQKAKVCSM